MTIMRPKPSDAGPAAGARRAPATDPEQRPHPHPDPAEPAPARIAPGEAQPSLGPPSELDERFKKSPWLFKKGNTTGAHRQKRSQVRLRMENLIQRLTDNGDVIVQFFCAVASGQPFVMRYVEKLPRTPEQEAVALGIATDLQKAEAKKQRRYLVTKRPYYPSMAEITEAFKWLADRGFGQAPKTVQIEGSVTTGFKMVFRKWAPGTDPASLPLSDMPKSIAVSRKMLDAKNGSNGHRA